MKDSKKGPDILVDLKYASVLYLCYIRCIESLYESPHLGVLESVYIKTQNPVLCRQKEFVFSLKLFN